MNKELLTNYFNYYVALITLIGFIILIISILKIIFEKDKKNSTFIKSLIKHALPIGFFITFFGTILSLFASEYLDMKPCGLCWFQRVFMYSQFVIFTIAYIKNENKFAFIYTFWLSIIGLIIALYQEYIQLGYSEIIPCPATSNFSDCAKPVFLEFGFITFPFAGAVMFGFLILISFLVNKYKK